MQHPFMVKLANDLAELRIATLRYQFPYTETREETRTPAVCHATVRGDRGGGCVRAVTAPDRRGGQRRTHDLARRSQTSAPGSPRFGVSGISPASTQEPSDARGPEILHGAVPMLFLQGARDAFAEAAELLNPLVAAPRQPGDVVLPARRGSFVPRARPRGGPTPKSSRNAGCARSWVAMLSGSPGTPKGARGLKRLRESVIPHVQSRCPPHDCIGDHRPEPAARVQPK